ncbi:type II toxin-antitoxin system VapC family toxin [Cyclobacterium roseum]|uniref:type II toxin-antitoxin system VapC family toxin n=1 Tax=Cyclobacterium roseum TaxID=2666137 RepID=UPI0013913C9E|nr:PIN domain nuclease [Cyclobacterium roseum]
MVLLIDTSIWIEFFRGEDEKLVRIVRKHILSNEVCICPPILQEILQGVRDLETFEMLSEQLMSIRFLEADPKMMAINAAKLYFNLRKKGVTVRKSMDCLIASYALAFDVAFYHADRDFDHISRHFPIKLFT